MKLFACTFTIVLMLNIAPALAVTRYEDSMDHREIGWMDRGKDSVKAKLKDGDSAKFRNVFFHRGKKDVPAACGEVNSKNSFGGYGGFQKFVSMGRPDFTFLEEEVSDFHKTWAMFCK